MPSYLKSFLSKNVSESLEEKNLAKVVSAFAKIELFNAQNKICDFYIQTISSKFGNLNSIRPNGKIQSKSKTSSKFFHLDNCPQIDQNHFKIEFDDVANRFQIVPLQKKIKINGQNYANAEWLVDGDIISINCKSHSHVLKFYLPSSDHEEKAKGVPANNILSTIVKSKYEIRRNIGNFCWTATEVADLVDAFKSFGMFRPSKLREKAKIEEKSLLEVQLFSMELVNFLYSKCKNWAEKSVESELLSILVKNESISDILDRIKTVFAEKFVKLDDLIKMNAEKCAADLVKSFGRTQFINELVATQRENGGNFETILKKSYKQIKEKPTREWTVHDDKKLILRLYEEGVDNYRFVSKNTRFGMEQTEIDENKRNLVKLGVIRKEIESTKDGVVSTLKLENRFDAIFNFWSGCAVRKSEMEDD